MGIIFDKPLIGVVMCQNPIGNHVGQTVHNKYLDAVVLAGGVPLPLPHQLMRAAAIENSMTLLDGILLTGSQAILNPHYGEEGHEAHADPSRDRLSFALITHASGKDADAGHLPRFAGAGGRQRRRAASPAHQNASVSGAPRR